MNKENILKSLSIISLSLLFVSSYSCNKVKEQQEEKEHVNAGRAKQTLDSLYAHYGVEGENLLRETYPFDNTHKATYLASEEQAKPNDFSYLWPYSGTFSAVNVLLEVTEDKAYKALLDDKVLPGLEEYFDQKRSPFGYASYINRSSASDRFYDDNVWLGIDFTDVYRLTKEAKYLDKAKLIWDFVWSGSDDKLGGGIYWCEQKKGSKHTCSNAPGSVFALKLFEATQDSTYFKHGEFLYHWTKDNLQDSTDYLYYDNIRLDGSVDKPKYAYNSGQMLQSAVMLYHLTGKELYLTDAQAIAKACHKYFFIDFIPSTGEPFRLIGKGDIWFTAVMSRGFIELYKVDKNPAYIESFQKSLDLAWDICRDENGLFNTDWTGRKKDNSKWLLTQAAMVEMYARFSSIDLQ